MNAIAEIDPVIAQAISTLGGAISMAIIAWATYYFPRGGTHVDDEVKVIKAKKHDDDDEEGE